MAFQFSFSNGIASGHHRKMKEVERSYKILLSFPENPRGLLGN